MTIELNEVEAKVLYKYLRKADEAYEELENVGVEETSELECLFINRIEESLEKVIKEVKND